MLRVEGMIPEEDRFVVDFGCYSKVQG